MISIFDAVGFLCHSERSEESVISQRDGSFDSLRSLRMTSVLSGVYRILRMTV